MGDHHNSKHPACNITIKKGSKPNILDTDKPLTSTRYSFISRSSIFKPKYNRTRLSTGGPFQHKSQLAASYLANET